MSGGHNGGGPCGACKFLRRKCVKGCIFAPYFDSEQGTVHFAAVHKVFGASNASKMLLRIPPHKRLDAVVTLCYEALARVRDPIYGCVAQIFALQQQVVNLQAELAYTQARISTFQRIPLLPNPSRSSSSSTNFQPCSEMECFKFNTSINVDPSQSSEQISMEMGSFYNPGGDHQELEDHVELQALAQDFVSKYLPGMTKFKPSTSQ